MPRLSRPRRRSDGDDPARLSGASSPVAPGRWLPTSLDPVHRSSGTASTSATWCPSGAAGPSGAGAATPGAVYRHEKEGSGGSVRRSWLKQASRASLGLILGRYFGSVSLGGDSPPELPAWLRRAMPDGGASSGGGGSKKWVQQVQAPLWVILSPPGQPDKKRLMTVQRFFKYAEDEGRRFFQELDSDGDGRLTLQDLRAAMRTRNLPEPFAAEVLKAARGGKWWQSSIGWDDFRAMMEAKEPRILAAFTSMEVSPSGVLQLGRIRGALADLGLPATEDNARAMLKALGGEDDGFVSYGKFRNFCLLLPGEKLAARREPGVAWLEAATVLPLGPPEMIVGEEERGGRGGGDSTRMFLLKAALAGGIASGSSTIMLHPIDTLKTRIQSTPGATIASVVRSVPQIGAVSLYRGIIPAAAGTFVGHGVRTFAYEASLRLFTGLAAGGAAELQAQGLASAVGTLLGTSIRIPCEIMKQRLQVGRQANVIAAFRAATASEGARGLFRGTAATLSREVPFYVLGMVGYQQLKKVARALAQGRELAPWETIALGFASGALAAVLTTPGDVMKTRIMTAPADKAVNASRILAGILRDEGPRALFKGAVPRVIWTAPQGAMNFAGYELAKRALTSSPPSPDGDGNKSAAAADATAATAWAPQAERARSAAAAAGGGSAGGAAEGQQRDTPPDPPQQQQRRWWQPLTTAQEAAAGMAAQQPQMSAQEAAAVGGMGAQQQQQQPPAGPLPAAGDRLLGHGRTGGGQQTATSFQHAGPSE